MNSHHSNPQAAETIRASSPGGRIENSPAFQDWVAWPKGVRPEGTAESAPVIQRKIVRLHSRDSVVPSGLIDGKRKPGSELPGYFQCSLRERTCPNGRIRQLPPDRDASHTIQAAGRSIHARVSADRIVASITPWARAPSWKVMAQGRCSRMA